ncbi:MAG: hypothetical protein U0Z26_12325 [Anaerolineales bacterium]
MSEIKNTQNINISDSKDVKLNDIHNTVTNHEAQVGIDEIERAFKNILQAVARLPEGKDKSEAELAVQSLEAEARQGEQAEEKSVHKWFKFLLDTAPDVFEVAVETFLNPIKGLSMVFQKIAQRMKAETKTGKA